MNVRLYLCTGVGGARHGFLAGWLGTLPNFIDNQWRIDPMTGHANGAMNTTMVINSGMSFNEFLSDRLLVLDATSDLCLAGQLHGHALIPYYHEIDYNCVTVVNVDVTNIAPSQIHWEFLVKTYLRKDRSRHNLGENNRLWNIDQSINQSVITNQDRIEKFKQLSATLAQSRVVDAILHSPVKFINLDYAKLFQIGGSQYLCNLLDITVAERHHLYWNQMLPLTQSPDEITVWDTLWRKSDFFN
jgi:hypothetical protein